MGKDKSTKPTDSVLNQRNVFAYVWSHLASHTQKTYAENKQQ